MNSHFMILLVVLASTKAFSGPPQKGMPVMRQGAYCFTMKPLSEFDETKCSPVKTQIKFVDCNSKESTTEEPIQVYARFECKLKQKQLKYWYKDSMLIGDLKKMDSGYEVINTKSVTYKSGRSYVGGLIEVKKDDKIEVLPPPTSDSVPLPELPKVSPAQQ